MGNCAIGRYLKVKGKSYSTIVSPIILHGSES